MMPNELAKLNVGGEKFVTTKSTLVRFPDSMFGAMFLGNLPTVKDEDGYYFIDRNPNVFGHILQFLRCGQLILPADFKEIELLKVEADFYQIKPLLDAIDDYEARLQPFQPNTVITSACYISSGYDEICKQFTYFKSLGDRYYSDQYVFQKTRDYKDFYDYLKNEPEVWKLVKEYKFSKAQADAYFISIGIDNFPFEKGCTYSSINVEVWKCCGI